MKPHEQRVLQEQADLDEKIARLRGFMNTDTFAAIDHTDQVLLRWQYNSMCAYSQALASRIARFTA